jgi:Tol biopolymer transport system component
MFEAETRSEIEIEAEILQWAYGPSWSPDGKQLAFTALDLEPYEGSRTADEGCKVFIIELATGEVRNVADGRAPSWSPDGGRIAYSRASDLYVADVDGSNEELLLTGGAPSITVRSTWSPDGDRIAASFRGNLVVIDSQNGDVRMAIDGWNPTWSPDGNWIAYSRSEPNPEATPVARDGSQPLHSVMYITRSDGSGEPLRLGLGTSPVWGPVP